jgi:acyl carrier protein
VNFMGTEESGHNVQFVESITTVNKGVRSHFLKARTDHEVREEPTTFMLRGSVSDPQPNALTQYEPVSRWANEVAQTQDMGSLLSPKNREATGTGINGHSRSSPFSDLETMVLQFLSTSQQCGAIVKVQFGDEPVRACYLKADKQLRESNQLSDERGGCLPLVPTRLPKHAMVSYETTNTSMIPKNPKAANKRVSAPGPAQSKKVNVSGVVQKTVEELLGTVVPNDAPLMGAGLDSLSVVDLVQTLGQRLGTELEPTALFDYPTVGSLIKYLAAQEEPETPLISESDDVVPVPLPTIEAGGKAIQECIVAATAMYLPTVEGSFTNGDLQGLSHGRFETATLVPATRWNMDSIDTRRFSADARSRMLYGSFLQSDFAMFDNTMFRISPAEARPLEPQQRMLLEVGYEALHRQGQNRSTLVDSDTGIFTGMMNMDAQELIPTLPGPYDLTGISYSAAGARLSYVFAMRGPCMVFDTACSSSLIAMHAARRSIHCNECPIALAIGPNAMLHPVAQLSRAVIGMTSIRGRCHTFDARADGYLRGEGCGAVVLETEQRGNHVSCLGSSARHNGQSATFTALNGLSQQLLIKAAL